MQHRLGGGAVERDLDDGPFAGWRLNTDRGLSKGLGIKSNYLLSCGCG